MKEFAPYIVPLLVAALILRRAGQMQKVNTGRMWIRPLILIVLLGGALAAAPMPGLIAIVAFVMAAIAGAALGYFMASHQHLSIHPETGQVSSRTTAIGTLLILGLFAIRFGARLVFPELGNPGHAQMTWAANGLLIFTVAVLITRTISIWRRTQPLLADHAARTASKSAAGPEGDAEGAPGRSQHAQPTE